MERRVNLFFSLLILLFSCISASADYVSTKVNRIFVDPDSVPVIADGYQAGDEISYILETTPKKTGGAVVGAGAWSTLYVPAGVVVIGAEIVQANTDGTYTAIPAKDVSAMQDGCGKRGCRITPTGTYENASLSKAQQDTGIFYSTDPRTDLLAAPLSISPTGPNVKPQNIYNQWDYDQIVAFGQKNSDGNLSGNDGKGNTPMVKIGGVWYGTGSPVAGPDTYYTNDYNPSCGAAFEADLGCTGPWNRIAYLNSKIAGSGAVSPAGPTTGTYVNDAVVTTAGYALSSSNPLPANTNAVRFVAGTRQVGDFELARITFRITDAAAFLADATSGTKFCLDATGGDHDKPGRGPQDNIWRYCNNPKILEQSLIV